MYATWVDLYEERNRRITAMGGYVWGSPQALILEAWYDREYSRLCTGWEVPSAEGSFSIDGWCDG